MNSNGRESNLCNTRCPGKNLKRTKRCFLKLWIELDCNGMIISKDLVVNNVEIALETSVAMETVSPIFLGCPGFKRDLTLAF